MLDAPAVIGYKAPLGTREGCRDHPDAKVAELVDALDLGSSAARRESSSLFFRTTGRRL
jgi:hypothetical protein